MLWLVEFIFPGFAERTLLPRLGLHYIGSDLFNPAQLFTYMFLHDPSGITHIFFNMFSLWMFGRILERVWGGKRYLLFYLVCGVGAAFAQEAVWAMTWRHEYIQGIAALNGLTYDHMQQIVDQATAAGDSGFLAGMADMKSRMMTVGASGAIFGLLLGFAFVFPNMPLYLFFIPVPIKARYMVIGYAVLEFFFGVQGGGTIAHFAHLGGMLFGLAMMLYWKKKGTLHGNGYY
jgi:membrane associated rhomboid family serine protease